MKHVQQTAMIGVTDVVVVQLPVAEDALALVAEDADRFGEQALDLVSHGPVEVVVQRLDRAREAAEQHPAARLYDQFGEANFRLVEVGRQSAFSLNAARKRHAKQ